MKVRIVANKDSQQWILGKFVNKLIENLTKLGISVDTDDVGDAEADINHLIPYNVIDSSSIKNTIVTSMVTHIDNIDKLNYIKGQSPYTRAFICMSSDHSNYLSQMGVETSKLCYINPAHDDIMKVKKLVVGWSCRVQEDGRKREYFIDRLAEKLDPKYFHFKIMGDNWDKQVEILRKKGFEVSYANNFDYQSYPQFIESLDYYLYMGMDEGQMGFVDALSAGIKTIVTSQGYHLDAQNGIVHPFKEYNELETIFLKIESEKRALVESVSTWKWFDYAKKHLEVWNYLLSNKLPNSTYFDGVSTLNKNGSSRNINYKKEIKKLKKEKLKHWHFRSYRLIHNAIQKRGLVGAMLNFFKYNLLNKK